MGASEERLMLSGMHTVADVYCCSCGQIVGWKYVLFYPSLGYLSHPLHHSNSWFETLSLIVSIEFYLTRNSLTFKGFYAFFNLYYLADYWTSHCYVDSSVKGVDYVQIIAKNTYLIEGQNVSIYFQTRLHSKNRKRAFFKLCRNDGHFWCAADIVLAVAYYLILTYLICLFFGHLGWKLTRFYQPTCISTMSKP